MLLSIVPKLEGARNYYAWHTALKGVLLWEDPELWEILTGQISMDNPFLREACTPSVGKLEGALLLTLELGPQLALRSVKTVLEKYKTLESIYGTPDPKASDLAWDDLREAVCTRLQDLPEYTDSLRKTRAKLHDMGEHVPDEAFWKCYRDGLDKVDDSLTSRQLDAIAWRETGIVRPATPASSFRTSQLPKETHSP